jgi:hypothetical protein
MNHNTASFLEALLFTSTEEIAQESIYSFFNEFVESVDMFIKGFENFLNEKDFDTDRLDNLDRNFGANVYFSLSGCGFYDKLDSIGDELQKLISEYAGRACFEELSEVLGINENGKIDLAILPVFIESERARYFKTIAR